MLDSLSTRLQSIFERLGGRGRLTEENIQEALREVRMALLEADVNFKVVRAFVDRVKEKAVGQDVLKSPDAGTAGREDRPRRAGRDARGQRPHRLATAPPRPTVIMLVGLQGSGKTTTRRQAGARCTRSRGSTAAGGRRPVPAGRRWTSCAPWATSSRSRCVGERGKRRRSRSAGRAREEAAARGLTPSSSTPRDACTSTRSMMRRAEDDSPRGVSRIRCCSWWTR